ncbi:Uncharacterised protein [BD1-7 clade bacterium]|uniref:Multidrug transporter n=1 Tax=BD1-7 clade bacterium TaxID=2029982 RepID=A0A5S9N273_9GAMM|nr:Uncharacterised protein [BD1-7 clade bacterium]CAA0083806.1 Uncharacterised protein [BD1-7 clade bacterium]CAA0116164.1 Uncharacterised protein [BD1-7 clade bacterium]
MSRLSQLAFVFAISVLLSFPRFAWAANDGVVVEEPSALAMAGDAAIVRPVMLGVTALGSLLFVVSLPFTLMGGNVGEAAETLVAGPGKTTFVRCLGCTKNGYKKKVTAVEGQD